MAKTDNLNDFLYDIAQGIQTAEGESNPYTVNPQDFRAKIETLKKVSGTKIITAAGTHDVTNYANAEVGTGSLTASGTATAVTTVAPGAVTIAQNSATVSGKTKISVTPTTATSGIGTYYMAIKANAAANTTGATSAISGIVTAKGSTAGYITTSSSATAAISGTATAKTSAKDSSVYYLPIASGAVTASGSATAAVTVAPGTVSIAANTTAVSGKTRVAITPTTATSGIGTYYIAVKASAAANTTGATAAISGTATAKGSTAGYIATTTNATAAISGTATAKTSAKDSSVYYLPLSTGAYTLAGGGLTGGGAVTPTVTLSSGSDTNMSNITVGAQDTTNYPYYFKVGATSTSGSKTITRAAVTATQTAGYIPGATTVATKISSGSATVTINQGSGNAYVGLKAATYTVAGGGLTSGSGTVSAALTATGITLGTAVTATPSSGPYIKVTGSGKVSMAAVTATQTAGYLPAATSAATLVSAVSNKSSNTATRYYPITGVSRADTTIGVVANSTNKTLTITATNNQSQGYQAGGSKTASTTVTLSVNSNTVTASAGTISVSRTVGTVFSGTTITPNRTIQTVVPAGRYTTGNVYVASIPETLVDTTSGTATAGEILSGKKAWVDGSEVTGTIATKTTSDLTASGAKVTVPAGYYAETVSKTISNGAASVTGGDLTAGAGSVSAVGSGVTLVAATTKPTSGYYVTATGSGKVTKAAVSLSKSAGYITGGATSVSSTTTINSSTATAYYTILTQEKEVTPTTSQQIIEPDDNYLLSQVIVKGYTESSGLSLSTYTVKITSSVGSATAYYTAGDGKQYSKTLSTTQQNVYVAEKTTLRVVGPSGTFCKLNGGDTYAQTIDGNTACMYFPTKPALATDTTATLTLDVTNPKVDTSSGDATAAQIYPGKKAWVDGAEITGTMATKAGGTIKPSSSATQTWAKGTYLTSTLTVAKEANLLPEYIKAGITICGVTGTYTGSSSGSAATCVLKFDTEYSLSDVTVTYIYQGQSKTVTVPEGSSAYNLTVDCNTDITLACSDGLWLNQSPWGNGVSYSSPKTLTTPASEGTYTIQFDNS